MNVSSVRTFLRRRQAPLGAATFAQRAQGERQQVRLFRAGAVVAAALALLEYLNPAGRWLLFEDLQLVAAPLVGTVAIAVSARQGEPEHRPLRRSLAVALGLATIGQLAADVPDLLPHAGLGSIVAVSDVCYVAGAVIGIRALMLTLHRRLDNATRQTALLDGLVIMLAAMTIVTAMWMSRLGVSDKGPGGAGLPGSPIDLALSLVSMSFFASAAAAVIAALALRLEPAPRGVWAVLSGIVLFAAAWFGWIWRMLAGSPDGIEAMDFLFAAGALLIGYGGLTWSLHPGGGIRYHRLAAATSEWLPVAAIVGCAVLDVMPRSRPFDIDPIAVGTCLVVMLAVARQRLSRNRERAASERLTHEIQERAATTVSLARLEAAATVEETAERICQEALHLDGIDTAAVFAFSQGGAVVPLSQDGLVGRPLVLGEALPEGTARELREHADFGLWLESWTDREPRDEFDRATIAAGLRAEALAPLFWNEQAIGLLALGTTSPLHARRLSERLATLTEFSVLSAAMLGPMLAERLHREAVRQELETTIAEHGFRPVFQPVIDLVTLEAVGFEALTRFEDGERPDLRFLAADRVGMMVRLETACLRDQIEDARRLPCDAWLSLNVSPSLATAVLPLIGVLEHADREIVLEITEHVEIEDYPRLVAALELVRGRARLAVDDAGAGYAGLRHILELRPQFVKLDISLVRSLDLDPARQAMVTGMAHFAADAGCLLIAEGIETPGELEALRRLGVPLGQGFLLARPAPAQAWATSPGRRSGAGARAAATPAARVRVRGTAGSSRSTAAPGGSAARRPRRPVTPVAD